METYIKLYRKIRNTSVWCDSDKLKLWLYCLTEASYEDRTILRDNKKIDLKKGQFLTGRYKLEADFNKGVKNSSVISGSTLVRWLELFEKCEMLHIKKTNKYSIVTVLNWDKYQCNEQQMNNSCTTDEQQLHNSCTHIKNIKNIKKEKNIKEKEINKEKEITMLTKTNDYIVTPEELDHWKELYPKVKVEEEMKSMVAWLESNPTRRKEKRYMKRFINSWLNKANKETKSEDVPSWYADTKQTEADESLKKEIARIQKELREET